MSTVLREGKRYIWGGKWVIKRHNSLIRHIIMCRYGGEGVIVHEIGASCCCGWKRGEGHEA